VFDNNDRAAYCIPSKPRFVESGAVRQSIHEREDAYLDAHDYADLLGRGVLLFSTWLVDACKNKRYMMEFLDESSSGQDRT
jgi:hypothetical protein